MVLRSGKARDRAKLDQKKARLQASRQRWRETHGMERDPEVLLRSAFEALDQGARPVRANPYAEIAGEMASVPKKHRRAAERLCLAAVQAELTDPEWGPRLLAVLAWRKRWRRRPEDWVPLRKGRPERRFGALLRWLFVQYNVPRRFDEPFLRNLDDSGPPHPGDPRQAWLIEVGNGARLRTCANLPFALTSRMAREIIDAPDTLGLYPAFRWGQVLGLGGREAVAERVARSPLGRPMHEEAEAFWTIALGHIARAPFLAPTEIDNLIDYLRFMRFGERGQRDQLRFEARADGFEWGRRQLRTVVTMAQAWQQRDRLHRGRPERKWEARNLDLEVAEGRFVELTSTVALVREGNALEHCVGSYDGLCASGRAAILSFLPTHPSRMGRVTVHVDLADRRVAEVRGRKNRRPSADEWHALQTWAKRRKVILPPR